MYRTNFMALAAVLIFCPSLGAGAQQDTAHKGMPGMKMPEATKPTQKPRPKAKTRAKSKAAATKTARNPAPAKAKSKATPKAQMRMTMPDSAHKRMADTSRAGHPPSQMQMKDTSPAPMQMRDTSQARTRDTTHMAMPGMKQATRPDTMAMAMAMEGPLGISMERMGSGTTWTPDAVTLPARHFMRGKWSMMLHGFAFAQYDRQGGPRGRGQFGSLNWAMLMADRPFAGGRFELRFMPSLDAATVGKCGYPLLLQSGEECNGKKLVDQQHPHDFFMELAALYERELTSKVAMLVYAAPAGEPALGPVAFMHRPSAMDNLAAPIGHHWQDATHISFGVVTGGLYTRTIRVEASAFNGIEPDDNRWNFDPIKLNSYSARLTVNPDTSWSFTAGYGTILEPGPADPNAKMHRVVASAMYGRNPGNEAQWASTLIYGANKSRSWSQSALLESEAVLDRSNTLFGRAEFVQKSGADLAAIGFPVDQLFNVGSVTTGYIRELKRGRGATIGIGASGTVNFVPSALEASYGSRTPLGAMLFLRLRPYHSPHQAMRMAVPMKMGDSHAP